MGCSVDGCDVWDIPGSFDDGNPMHAGDGMPNRACPECDSKAPEYENRAPGLGSW